jgi:lipopolysaccharide transport system ATP-binding protein
MCSVISVENLGKMYLLNHQANNGSYVALRDVLSSGVKEMSRRLLNPLGSAHAPANSPEEFWALRDVSFEVKQGDRIGIIGRNGAGKSTLLKVLSRITEPSTGCVRIKGRVASLLEVGTGFHPELTGRENIYLNGAILGMSRAEIKRKFDDIVDFAEVERFLDTPVKRYSSGMYVKLAFAVAAYLEPEILVVDEVLAVGDLQFQKKCLGKMQDVSAKEGRTVLFVSHNIEAVRKLCQRCILLEKGAVIADDSTDNSLKAYLSRGFQHQEAYRFRPPKDPDAPGFATLLVVEDLDGKPATEFPVGKPWQVRVHFTVRRKTDHFIIGLGMMTELNTPLRTAYSTPRDLVPGEYEAVFKEDNLILATGSYQIIIGLSSFERTFHYTENAGAIKIAEFTENLDLVRIKNVGLILNPLQIEIIPKKIA